MNVPQSTLSWSTLLRMTRPGFLAITTVACVLGMASAAASGCRVNVFMAVATVGLACLAHAAANVLNDYHDALNGADAANKEGLFPFSGGARLIQNGEVTPEMTRRVAWAMLCLSAVGGILLALYSGSDLLWIGLAGLLLGWAYSAPPLQLMSRGLGELAVSVVWWLMVVGADHVFRGEFSAAPAVMAVGYGVLIGNILLVNGFPDAPADAHVGKRTLVVQLGPSVATMLYTFNVLLAHSWTLVAAWPLESSRAALWGLLSLPVALAAAGLLWQRRHRPQHLRPAIGLTISAAVVHGLALAGGLTWTTAPG